MIIDERAMFAALQQWEAKLEADGWDAMPPLLGQIVCLRRGRTSAVICETPPMQPAALAEDANDGLVRIAELMESGEGDAEVRAWHPLQADAQAGLLYSYEAWASESEGRVDPEQVPLGDDLSDFEVREVVGVDCAGQVYMICRRRDRKPVGAILPVDDPAVAIRACVVNPLARILRGLLRFAPPDAYNRDALEHLIKETA